MRVLAVSPSSPAALRVLRGELGLSAVLLASDPGELAVASLCGGVSHCVLILDSNGAVTWGAWSESWAELPKAKDLLEAARNLRR